MVFVSYVYCIPADNKNERLNIMNGYGTENGYITEAVVCYCEECGKYEATSFWQIENCPRCTEEIES